MKKDCEYTRRMLPRYLSGRLFRLQARRVEGHLRSCPFCRSEADALRRVLETRQILRDIEPAEGAAGRVLRRGAARLSGMTRLLYRPLWFALVLVSAGVLYLYVISPLFYDPDLEKLDGRPGALTSFPSPTVATFPSLTAGGPAAAVPAAPAAAPPPPAAASDPLLITIAVEKEAERVAIRRLNDAMQEHAFLQSMRFSETVREVSGSLTADELYTLFDRIRSVGKITYKRSRLASGSGDMIPFVMRLQASGGAKHRIPPQPVDNPVDRPVEKAADNPVDKPGENPADPPGNAAEPALPQPR